MAVCGEELEVHRKIKGRRRIGLTQALQGVPGVGANQVQGPTVAVGKVSGIRWVDPQGSGGGDGNRHSSGLRPAAFSQPGEESPSRFLRFLISRVRVCRSDLRRCSRFS